MKVNLLKYRAELQAKLDAVDLLLKGETPEPVIRRSRPTVHSDIVKRGRPAGRPMSEATKAKIAQTARLRWKKRKAAGHNTL